MIYAFFALVTLALIIFAFFAGRSSGKNGEKLRSANEQKDLQIESLKTWADMDKTFATRKSAIADWMRKNVLSK